MVLLDLLQRGIVEMGKTERPDAYGSLFAISLLDWMGWWGRYFSTSGLKRKYIRAVVVAAGVEIESGFDDFVWVGFGIQDAFRIPERSGQYFAQGGYYGASAPAQNLGLRV